MIQTISRSLRMALAAAVAALFVVTAVDAQGQASKVDPGGALQRTAGVSFEELKTRRSVVENLKDVDEATKKTALGYYDQALSFHELTEQYRQDKDVAASRIKASEARTKEARALLKKPLPPVAVEPDAAGLSTARLERRAREEEAKLKATTDSLARWNSELENQKNLLKQLPDRISKTNQRLTEVQDELRLPAPTQQQAFVSEARQLALSSELVKAKVELSLYEQLLAGHESIMALLTVERDLAGRQAKHQETVTAGWRAALQSRRESEAAKARIDAQEAQAKSPALEPVLKKELDLNVALGEELEMLTKEELVLVKELSYLQGRLQDLEDEQQLARERVELISLGGETGYFLRELKQSLPDVKEFKEKSYRRKLKSSQYRERQLELDRARRKLADLDEPVDRIVTEKLQLVLEDEQVLGAVKGDLRTALAARRDLVDKLQAGYSRALKYLSNIEVSDKELTEKAHQLEGFLDRHLLWIRSSKPVGWEDLGKLKVAVSWFADPDLWWQFRQDLKLSMRLRIKTWVVGLLLAVLLLAGKRYTRKDLYRTADRVNRQDRDSFGLTLRAFFATVWIAAAWPFIFGLFAYQLARLPMPNILTQAVTSGLFSVATILLLVGFFYHVFAKEGLGQAHLQWPDAAVQSFRSNLRWYIPCMATFGFFIASMKVAKKFEYSDALAITALIVLSLSAFIFLASILRPGGAIMASRAANRPHSWTVRLRYVWFPIVLSLPLFQTVLAAGGYFYSALEMRNLIGTTVLLVVALMLLRAMGMKWLAILHRNLILKSAVQEEATATEAQAPDHGDLTVDDPDRDLQPPPITDDSVEKIGIQSRNILNSLIFIAGAVALWIIWEPIFPALGILESVQLWSYSATVDGVMQRIPVDLADLLLAALLVVATFLASRNLPGFMEITVLNAIPMDFGARQALVILSRYVIIAVGVMTMFSVVGVKWSTIQWLVAALSVGLGFGLQEVVANFISGIIVLFERPFRVGDVVTIGDTSGTVSRVQIRATTIIDFDRKELIVPNKEFITGKLINWSLSDKVIRIRVPVGIAYGSDTDLAERLMLKSARANPMVLRDPEPNVIFTGFGDNALSFELRVFVNGIDHWYPMLHRLNRAIDREFRKAGITIAFPQRDVHLDATGPLEVKVVPADSVSANLSGQTPSAEK
ncbi:MAG: hypothetical protein AMJ54_11495 [Deltaproteobacteria bacterium SG8_13]|nr:MAG: hypothetical protein AMJ54_11495 [Deltaproteobacteria bacterium SG8_13]